MQPVTLTLDAKTPKFPAVIRSFKCDSVESAILEYRKQRKLWFALGALEIVATYSFDGKTFDLK